MGAYLRSACMLLIGTTRKIKKIIFLNFSSPAKWGVSPAKISGAGFFTLELEGINSLPVWFYEEGSFDEHAVIFHFFFDCDVD